MNRYLQNQVEKDLAKKMVFLAGPRQVGKTTLAKQFLASEEGYLNWDIKAHHDQILLQNWPRTPVLVLDEIHKYKSWRNMLKGLYDDRKGRQQILVTGSARLDYYRYSGDSLQGRYHLHHLYPLSVAELKISTNEDFHALLQLGGFPEPFLSGSEDEARRWSREYRHRFIDEDVKSLESVQDIGKLELLILRLPELVGAPLSINALREDLQINHRTVARWIDILERLYMVFLVTPFGAPKIRAVKKEKKHYHYNWNSIPEQGYRFENFVAVHLKKWVDYQNDVRGTDYELRYFRDVNGNEVDFVVVDKKTPLLFVECKWSDESPSRTLFYLKERFPQAEAWQVSAVGTKDYTTKLNVAVCPARKFLQRFV